MTFLIFPGNSVSLRCQILFSRKNKVKQLRKISLNRLILAILIISCKWSLVCFRLRAGESEEGGEQMRKYAVGHLMIINESLSSH